MQTSYFKTYSPALQRDMEVKVYGHAGKPCLVFPSQDGRYYDFENFGMPEAAQPHIDQGRLRLYCVDTIDRESWSAQDQPPYDRLRRHEAWFSYLVDEFYPAMRQHAGWDGRAMTLGCSLGAMHAANILFRRPDLFDTVIALSGAYSPEDFLGGYMDEVAYINSPVASIRGMAPDHPYIDLLNTCRIILCVGQGAWEDEMLHSTRQLDEAMREKGIRAWVDYWGYDVNHDWPWWRRQLAYYLDKIMAG
ncbi:MAG: esterase family protein [Christensenellales bacterium]